jgi:hypothetical protein
MPTVACRDLANTFTQANTFQATVTYADGGTWGAGGISASAITTSGTVTASHFATSSTNLNTGGLNLSTASVIDWWGGSSYDTYLIRGAAGQLNVSTTGSTGDASGTLKAAAVNATSGFQVNGAAVAGNYLRGNGTNFVASALQSGDITTALGFTPYNNSNPSGYITNKPLPPLLLPTIPTFPAELAAWCCRRRL